MNPPVNSAPVLAFGLPELYRVALGVGQPREASVRVDLRVHFDVDASFAKLGDHLIEVADAEVDHPLEPPVAEVRRVLPERREGSRPSTGPPRRGPSTLRDAADAEIGLIPLGQFFGILGTEEEPTNSLHPFHIASSLACRWCCAGRHCCRAGNRDSNRCSTSDVRRMAHVSTSLSSNRWHSGERQTARALKQIAGQSTPARCKKKAFV